MVLSPGWTTQQDPVSKISKQKNKPLSSRAKGPQCNLSSEIWQALGSSRFLTRFSDGVLTYSLSFTDEALIYLFSPSVQLWMGTTRVQWTQRTPRQWPGFWSISFQVAGFKSTPAPAQTRGTSSCCKACNGSGHSAGLGMGASTQKECAELLGSNNKKSDYSKRLMLEPSQGPR